jgi:hypothetical protein
MTRLDVLTLPLCTDQWQCARHYAANETSWRMTPAEHVLAWSGSRCPQCGGRYMTAAEMVAALLTPDALPEYGGAS